MGGLDRFAVDSPRVRPGPDRAVAIHLRIDGVAARRYGEPAQFVVAISHHAGRRWRRLDWAELVAVLSRHGADWRHSDAAGLPPTSHPDVTSRLCPASAALAVGHLPLPGNHDR